MPTTLTDASSFDAVTSPTGADIRNAASVQSAMQSVANRTRFLVDRGTPLADLAALSAIALPEDGLVRFVGGYGAYVFDVASAVAEALPFVVAPGAGPGRWIGMGAWFNSALTPLLGTPGNLATLDGSTKVTAAQRTGWIVDTARVQFTNANVQDPATALFTTTSTTYTSITGLYLAFASKCNNGDIFEFECSFPYMGNGRDTWARLVVNDGGTDVVQTASEQFINTVSPPMGYYRFHGRHVLANVGTGGTAEVRAECKRAPTGAISGPQYVMYNAIITARLIRP